MYKEESWITGPKWSGKEGLLMTQFKSFEKISIRLDGDVVISSSAESPKQTKVSRVVILNSIGGFIWTQISIIVSHPKSELRCKLIKTSLSGCGIESKDPETGRNIPSWLSSMKA